ncbi:MAG TPA: hypothetical protein VNW15_10155 [Rhizomicrobium sp.]|nr:hypothetical protein [Rhizomicrobium sp.]
MSGSQRLSNLLELANQGPAMRAALAEELAELLAAWPADCPAEMRAPCEALLARAACEVDDDTRRRLRERLHAAPGLAARILPREPEDRTLVGAARSGEAVAPHIARALGISENMALEVLCDESGHALAAAAKTLGLTRAAFSSLVLLACPVGDAAASQGRLNAFDAMSERDAKHQLRRWTREAHAAE